MNKNSKIMEERCMNIAIKQVPQLYGFKISEEDERPDFILENDGLRIGVEHFLVDTLAKERDKKTKNNEPVYDSFSRQYDKKAQSLYDDYKDTIAGREKDALNDIMSLVTDFVTAQSGFNCYLFEKGFITIFYNHLMNACAYREHNISKLGFLCEIDIPTDDYMWLVRRGAKFYEQKINSIPMLKLMAFLIDFALKSDMLDFVILTTIPICNLNNAKSCYYDKSSSYSIYDAFAFKR